MKRSKFYFQIGIVVMLTLVCALFFGGTAYFLYKNDSGTAGVFATLIGIPLTIVIALWSYILGKFQKDTLIERYLNDEHFVDRDIEYIKLSNLIQYEPDRIIYINGKFGMGKCHAIELNIRTERSGSLMPLFIIITTILKP